MGVSSAEADSKGANVRFPPPLVFVTGIVAGIGLNSLVPMTTPIARAWTLPAGYAAFAAGLGLIVWAVGLFRATGQDPAPWTPTSTLVFRGPYQFSRNPMYVGMTLIQVGFGLWLDTLWIVLLSLPALAIVHYVAVRREEAYLSARFGEPYRNYLKVVRRYL